MSKWLLNKYMTFKEYLTLASESYRIPNLFPHLDQRHDVKIVDNPASRNVIDAKRRKFDPEIHDSDIVGGEHWLWVGDDEDILTWALPGNEGHEFFHRMIDEIRVQYSDETADIFVKELYYEVFDEIPERLKATNSKGREFRDRLHEVTGLSSWLSMMFGNYDGNIILQYEEALAYVILSQDSDGRQLIKNRWRRVREDNKYSDTFMMLAPDERMLFSAFSLAYRFLQKAIPVVKDRFL